MIKKLLIISLFCFSFSVQASFKEKVFQWVENYFGYDVATKLLGEKQSPLTMPAIPQQKKDARKVEALSKIQMPKVKLDPSQLSQDNQRFIRELFNTVRNEKPHDMDYVKWGNVLNQGATREGVYRALVLDMNYYKLESESYPTNEKVRGFTQHYLDRYLNKEVQATDFNNTNFYLLKRMVTEETLEVMDLLKRKPEDLANWYGIFSGEVARKYPQVWQSSFRANDSDLLHKQWSLQMGEQMIKSEVILKIHKIFNYLYFSNDS